MSFVSRISTVSSHSRHYRFVVKMHRLLAPGEEVKFNSGFEYWGFFLMASVLFVIMCGVVSFFVLGVIFMVISGLVSAIQHPLEAIGWMLLVAAQVAAVFALCAALARIVDRVSERVPPLIIEDGGQP